MKLSINVLPADVEAPDDFARAVGMPSRSAAVQHTIRLLRLPDLEADFAAAWEDWEASGHDDRPPPRIQSQGEQTRSVGLERAGPAVGHLSADLLAEIDDAVRIHLDL